MVNKNINERDQRWLDYWHTDSINNSKYVVYLAIHNVVVNNLPVVAFDYPYTDSLGDILSEFFLRGYMPINIHSAKLEDERTYWRVVLQKNE